MPCSLAVSFSRLRSSEVNRDHSHDVNNHSDEGPSGEVSVIPWESLTEDPVRLNGDDPVRKDPRKEQEKVPESEPDNAFV